MKKLLPSLISLLVLAGVGQQASAQDAKAGQKKAAMCIGCHGIPGYQASFPQIYKVPMISGQGAKYIASALAAYKKGERKFTTMQDIAASLSDQDMADLAAFYEQQGKQAGDAAPAPAVNPPANVAALLTKGNCVSCHGDNFSKPIDPSYPKLAGQHATYLNAALRAYQVEKNPLVGRSNAIMAGMAKPFSHAEIKVLADYIASLPSELKTVEQSHFAGR